MSAAHPQYYQYADSLQETGEIRLFSVGRAGDGPIECTFTHAQLVQVDPGNDPQARSGGTERRWSCELPYFAISYTWGLELKEDTVVVEGKPFPVTRNLYHVLRDICLENAGCLFWADAISIDQGNHTEKSDQVMQMPFIYEAAEQVFVLLREAGHTDPMLRHLFKAFEDFDRQTRGSRWPPNSSEWGLQWSASLAKSVLDSQLNHQQQSATLTVLFSHPWFERVWIIQEIAKARSVIIYSSGHHVSSRVFAITPTLIPTVLQAHRQAILDVMPGTVREASWWAEDRSLQNLVLKFHNAKARFGQDKIYALLGICDDPDARNIIVPDYTKKESEVVRDVLAFMFSVPRERLVNGFTTIDQLTGFLLTPKAQSPASERLLHCVLSHTSNPQTALKLLRDRALLSITTSDESLLDAICQNEKHGNQILSGVLHYILNGQSISPEASSKLACRDLTHDEFWNIWMRCSSRQIIRQCWPPPLRTGNTQIVITRSSVKNIMRSRTWWTPPTEGGFVSSRMASSLIHRLFGHDSGLPEVVFSAGALVELMRRCEEDELRVLLHAPTKTAEVCRLLLSTLWRENLSFHAWRIGQTTNEEIHRLLLPIEKEIDDCTYRGLPDGSDESWLRPWAHLVKISSIVNNSLPLKQHTTGFSALTRAITMGELSSVSLLVRQGADLNEADHYGLTPVLWARHLDRMDVFSMLEKHGADPYEPPDSNNVSPRLQGFHIDITHEIMLHDPWSSIESSLQRSWYAAREKEWEAELEDFISSLICDRYGRAELAE